MRDNVDLLKTISEIAEASGGSCETVVAIGTREQEVVAVGGHSSTERVFPIASLTKMFVARLCRIVMSQHEIQDSALVSKWIPEGREKLMQVSIAELLDHRSGLGDYVVSADDLAAVSAQTRLADAALEALKRSEAETNCDYSNTGYLLLGLMLERLTQQSVEELFEEKIARPLKLSNTKFLRPEDVGVSRTDLGWTDGALFSTAEDLLKWARTIEVPPDLRLNDSRRSVYRDGLMWERSPSGSLCYWHSGSGPSISALIVGSVEEQNALVFLSNIPTPQGEGAVDSLLNFILK